MSERADQAKSIFLEAIDHHAPEKWPAFLDRACAGDANLRAEVDQLLRAQRDIGSFHEKPREPAVATIDLPVVEGPGTLIGPFKLLEQIGEGGFGVVFLAEQTEPVRRKVALKILRPGMDSRQIVARFEAERQALAIMDHPNIARVFDGGTTASGRPYFVMELVKGAPITEFCDQNHLTPRQRLELFLSVCSAVQHAHQKGIIHRDLKPSNVLVTRHDTTPIVKVIDFGIAKALGQELTDKTLFTGIAQMIGTPLYMSPEQAGMSDLDVDTRSDIYSLGVLLYELLTGTTPFTKERFKKAAYDEIRRIIREEEPPKPSTRLSDLGRSRLPGGTSEATGPARQTAPTSGLASVSVQRNTEPAKLTKLIRGELDWIVMKAMEKDRNRRYETANDFAMDLQRHLADEPVQASPQTTAYRLRKFMRRNKRVVLAVTAIFLLLITGITGTTWGLVRAEKSRQEENRQRKLAEAAATSESEQRDRAEKAHQKAAREAAIAAAINDFLDKDILQLSTPLGQATHGLTPDVNLKIRTVLLRAAQRIDGKFADQPEVEMKIRYTIGNGLSQVGEYAGALPQYQKVIPYFQVSLGPDHPETLLAEYRMAALHRHLGHSEMALALLEQNLEKHKAALGPHHAQTLVVMNGLSSAYRFAGQKEKALQLAEETLELRKRHLSPDDGDTLVSMNNVAELYLQQMQIDKALPLFEATFARMQKKFAALHPERLNTTRNLARAYHAAEQIDKAIPLQQLVLRQFKIAYGLDYAMTQTIIDDLVAYYVDMGWCDKAQTLLTTIQTGGANRPTIPNQKQVVPDRLNPLVLGGVRTTSPSQRQDLREKHHRELIERVRPAADKYVQELAAKKADHQDTLAARQAFAIVLRNNYRNSAAAFQLNAVLDARQRLMGADHLDTQTCRLELGTTRLRQHKYAEAEPLLLEAYAAMKRQESDIPAKSKALLLRALERLVQLYDGWDKKDKALEWRQRLDEQKKS